MAFFDKFFGYLVLPLTLHVGGRTNLHQTVKESYDWAISLGREGYERALRAYQYSAAKPIIGGLVMSAVLQWAFIIIAGEVLRGEQSALFRHFVSAMYTFTVIELLYAWHQRHAIAHEARNEDGTPVRNQAGERTLDEDYPYIPQRLSLKTSALLIVVSGLVLSFGLLVSAAAFESTPLLILGIVSFTIPVAILYVILHVIVHMAKKATDYLEASIGFMREQVLVLAAGHTFETIMRGPASLVRQEGWKLHLEAAIKLLVTFYLQHALIQLVHTNWNLFLFTLSLHLVVLIASAIRWVTGGKYQVLNAIDRFAGFQFKWIPWIAGVVLAWKLLFPKWVKDLPSDAWSWVTDVARTDYCFSVERRWGRNLGSLLLCLVGAVPATAFFFKLMNKMREDGWFLRAVYVIPAIVAGLAMIGFGFGTLRGATFLALNAADKDKEPICSPWKKGDGKDEAAASSASTEPKDVWTPLSDASDADSEKPVKKNWGIKPPASTPAPQPTVVVQAQPREVPNEPKPPAHAPTALAERKPASERDSGQNCRPDFIAWYKRHVGPNPSCAH